LGSDLPASQTITVDGLQTSYVTKGSGTPIVLMHGGSPGACARVNWGANISALADAGFAVYAYDQPGYGNTTPPTDHSLEYRVRHAHEFIKALGLKRFHLFGNSQGAYVAARVALEDPRALSMVLVASGTLSPPGSAEARELSEKHRDKLASYEPSLENMRKLSMGTLFHKELVTEEFVKLRYEMSSGIRYESQQKRQKAPKPKSIWEDIGRIKLKTLLFWGLHDGGAAVERGILLLRQLHDAELHVFSQSGHWLQYDERDRFNALTIQFLQGIK
jgi:pimeloyl-ACP methyl ester carboxylesterase